MIYVEWYQKQLLNCFKTLSPTGFAKLVELNTATTVDKGALLIPRSGPALVARKLAKEIPGLYITPKGSYCSVAYRITQKGINLVALVCSIQKERKLK